MFIEDKGDRELAAMLASGRSAESCTEPFIEELFPVQVKLGKNINFIKRDHSFRDLEWLELLTGLLRIVSNPDGYRG